MALIDEEVTGSWANLGNPSDDDEGVEGLRLVYPNDTVIGHASGTLRLPRINAKHAESCKVEAGITPGRGDDHEHGPIQML